MDAENVQTVARCAKSYCENVQIIEPANILHSRMHATGQSQDSSDMFVGTIDRLEKGALTNKTAEAESYEQK